MAKVNVKPPQLSSVLDHTDMPDLGYGVLRRSSSHSASGMVECRLPYIYNRLLTFTSWFGPKPATLIHLRYISVALSFLAVVQMMKERRI